MRLSDFKGEDAIELLANIMEPASKILNDEKVKELKGQSYMDIAVYVLKNHKSEVLEVYNLLYDEEATPIRLINMLLDILNDPELKSLFISQGQNEENPLSGSAMESTEDGEN